VCVCVCVAHAAHVLGRNSEKSVYSDFTAHVYYS
jgi:hypothetical protein